MAKLTKDEIRDKAIQMFLDRGYNNVTVIDICKECGITKPTFYKYAVSKEELIADLYDITVKELVTDTFHFVNANTHVEQLLMIFNVLINDTEKFGSDLFSQLIILNLNDNHHSFDLRSSLTEIAVTIIKKAQEKGEIRNLNDPEKLYQTLGYSFFGYEVTWCMYNATVNLRESMYDTIINVLDVREDLRIRYKDYMNK